MSFIDFEARCKECGRSLDAHTEYNHNEITINVEPCGCKEIAAKCSECGNSLTSDLDGDNTIYIGPCETCLESARED